MACSDMLSRDGRAHNRIVTDRLTIYSENARRVAWFRYKYLGSALCKLGSVLFCGVALFLAFSHAKIECCRLQSSSTCTMEKVFCGVVWKDLNDLTLQLEKLKQNYGGRLKVIWYFLVLFTWWKTMFSVYVIQLLFLVCSTLYSWLSFRFLLLLLLLSLLFCFCFVVVFFFFFFFSGEHWES